MYIVLYYMYTQEKLQGGGGSGFGLYMCKGVVDLHGGQVSVFSEGEGKGSTFTLKIPMKHKEDRHRMTQYIEDDEGEGSKNDDDELCSNRSNIRVALLLKTLPIPLSTVEDEHFYHTDGGNSRNHGSPNAVAGGGPSSTSALSRDSHSHLLATSFDEENDDKNEEDEGGMKYRLLVVDDSLLSRKMLIKTLQSYGHTCESAEDGLEAVEKVKLTLQHIEEPHNETAVSIHFSSYDAILMDYMMPRMNGPTATSEIRALGFHNKIFGVTGKITI